MKRLSLKLIVIVVLLIVVTLGGIFWWFGGATSENPVGRYQTAEVVRGRLERTVSSTGTLAAVETVDVGTEVSGTVARVMVDFNDRVSKGMVLAELKPDLFNAAVADAEASVRTAEADNIQAQQDLERNRPLYQQGYLAEQEFLPFRTASIKAQAALDSARAGLDRARTNLRNTVIRSPIEGTVIQRSIDAGQTVAASLNTPTLFIIAQNLEKMQIEAAVDETDIGQIRVGQQVRFTVQSYPEQTFTGEVLQIRLQPTTVQNVVTYTVIVSAGNAQRLLLPGMTATVDFILEQVENALLVPNAALRFRPESSKGNNLDSNRPVRQQETGSGVFVESKDRALRRLVVEIGSSDGLQTVILSGELQAGDQVITGVTPQAAAAKKSFSLFGAMRPRPRR